MAKDSSNQGGPTRNPKDQSSADRSNPNVRSRDELQERSVQGARPGRGQRNGSSRERG